MSYIFPIIMIILVVYWVVRGLSALTGSKPPQPNPQRRQRPIDDWDEVEAQRRSDMQRGDASDALGQMRADASGGGASGGAPDMSQMTMAERIELARKRARQQTGGPSQPPPQQPRPQPQSRPMPQSQPTDDPAEALRQARERAEREAQRRRMEADSQAQARREAAERAQAERDRQRRQSERRRAQQEQAEAEKRARQQRQRKPRRQPTSQSQPSASSPSTLRTESFKRVHQGQSQQAIVVEGRGSRAARGGVQLGVINADSLRKAFVMKELLDKPIALREPQDDLLS